MFSHFHSPIKKHVRIEQGTRKVFADGNLYIEYNKAIQEAGMVLKENRVLKSVIVFVICLIVHAAEVFFIRTDETVFAECFINKVFGIVMLFVLLKLWGIEHRQPHSSSFVCIFAYLPCLALARLRHLHQNPKQNSVLWGSVRHWWKSIWQNYRGSIPLSL